MKIFVISLKKDILRREQIIQKLTRYDLEFEFFDAIYGKDIPSRELPLVYKREQAIEFLGKELTPGEIGCSLSHIYIYKIISENLISEAVIFEDDVVLKEDITPLLEEIKKRRNIEPEVILLSEVGLFRTKKLASFRQHSLHDIAVAWRTHAYYINLKGARALYDLLFPVHLVADHWIWINKQKSIHIRCVIPHCVGFEEEIVSNIDQERLNSVPNALSNLQKLLKFSAIYREKIRNRLLLLFNIIQKGF